MAKTKRKDNVVAFKNTHTPKIEKGVPIPTRATQFDFCQDMDKGDSFFLPETHWELTKAQNAVRQWGYTRKMYFTMRREEKGLRVWRI